MCARNGMEVSCLGNGALIGLGGVAGVTGGIVGVPGPPGYYLHMTIHP